MDVGLNFERGLEDIAHVCSLGWVATVQAIKRIKSRLMGGTVQAVKRIKCLAVHQLVRQLKLVMKRKGRE
jgi:hypothetical protein